MVEPAGPSRGQASWASKVGSARLAGSCQLGEAGWGGCTGAVDVEILLVTFISHFDSFS